MFYVSSAVYNKEFWESDKMLKYWGRCCIVQFLDASLTVDIEL